MAADQNEIYRVMYVSKAVRPLTAGELDDLLAGAQLRNKAHGISGILVYDAGSFLQVLEGPPTRSPRWSIAKSTGGSGRVGRDDDVRRRDNRGRPSVLKADGHIRIPAALWKSVGAKPGQSSVVSDAVTVPETAQENA